MYNARSTITRAGQNVRNFPNTFLIRTNRRVTLNISYYSLIRSVKRRR